MNLTALRYFHEVVNYGSIRQAAERVHIAASALSRQISKLEHEFGAPLLERRATGVVLTPAGHLLAQHTRTMFRDLHRLKSKVDDLKAVKRGQVTLFTIEGIVSDLLPEIMSSFLNEYPNISFVVFTGGSDRIQEAVVGDEADIGITFSVKPRPEVEVVLSHPLPSYAVFAPSHQFASKKRLSVRAVLGQKLVVPDTSFGLRRLIDRVAFNCGVEVREALRTNSFALMKMLACTGHAVAILPKAMILKEIASGELCAVRIEGPDFMNAQIQVCIHRNRNLTSAAQRFLDHTLLHFRNTSAF